MGSVGAFAGNPHGVCQCLQSTVHRRVTEVAGGQVRDHTLRLPDVKAGSTLLGDYAQLCHAFWHVPTTPEAGFQSPVCLRAACDGDACVGKGTVLVARLQDATGLDRYVARYHNCPDNEHAEAFLLRDEALQQTLSTSGEGARLVLYLNRQPCHNSGNHLRESTSCTAALLGFFHQQLSPRRIALEVAICYTYRAHWELQHLRSQRDRDRYGPAILAAREGLALVAEAGPGVSLRALHPQDWTWLLRLCDPAVRDDWDKRDNAGIVFTAQQRAARSAMDRFTTAVINEHSRRRPAAPTPAVSEPGPFFRTSHNSTQSHSQSRSRSSPPRHQNNNDNNNQRRSDGPRW